MYRLVAKWLLTFTFKLVWQQAEVTFAKRVSSPGEDSLKGIGDGKLEMMLS
jgi:hypothetical protein